MEGDLLPYPADSTMPLLACTNCRSAHQVCGRKRPCTRCVSLGEADQCHSTARAFPPSLLTLSSATSPQERPPEEESRAHRSYLLAALLGTSTL